jgi:hypothetical protein
MLKSLAALLVLSFSLQGLAAGNEKEGSKSSSKSNQIGVDDVRCEKSTGISLAEFKAKLVDNCDLNKPYSANLSKVLSDEIYFYCCQKK